MHIPYLCQLLQPFVWGLGGGMPIQKDGKGRGWDGQFQLAICVAFGGGSVRS